MIDEEERETEERKKREKMFSGNFPHDLCKKL